MPKEPPSERSLNDDHGILWFIGIIMALAVFAICYVVLATVPSTALPPAHVKVETAKGHGSATHIGGGLYITAAHVVTDQPEAKIDGAPSEILWVNRQYDIALMRGPASAQAIPLACVTPFVGQSAEAHGNPVDLTEITTTVRVAGIARECGHWKVVVPVDGALAPGMSGGGIVDGGRLIGVTVGVSVVPMGLAGSLYGVGFVVPGAVVCELMGRQ